MSNFRTRYRQLIQDSRQEKPVSFPALFWLFIAGSLIGFIMEGCWHYLHTGTWGFRVATLWGPFCIIYGVGTAAMYLIALVVQNRPVVQQFLAFALTGSGVEYIAGVFQEKLFGTVSWDYSHHPLNIGGRISLRMTLLWGMIGMCAMYLLLPLMLRAFNQLHLTSRTGLCRAAAIFMAMNLLWTSIALLRWRERTSTATPSSNIVEAWMDRTWPDERLQQRFPNMVFTQ